MKPNNATNEILELILAECRYWHGRDEARRGSFAILYAAAKKVAEKHDKAANEPQKANAVHGESVEVGGFFSWRHYDA